MERTFLLSRDDTIPETWKARNRTADAGLTITGKRKQHGKPLVRTRRREDQDCKPPDKWDNKANKKGRMEKLKQKQLSRA